VTQCDSGVAHLPQARTPPAVQVSGCHTACRSPHAGPAASTIITRWCVDVQHTLVWARAVILPLLALAYGCRHRPCQTPVTPPVTKKTKGRPPVTVACFLQHHGSTAAIRLSKMVTCTSMGLEAYRQALALCVGESHVVKPAARAEQPQGACHV
jgi:hypothetical protein